MSILLGNQIAKEVENGRISIDPFNAKFIGPNSVDVTLHRVLKTYEPMKIVKNERGHHEAVPYGDNLSREPLDLAKDNKTYEMIIPSDGLILCPGYLYLGSTNEVAGTKNYVPMYEGRSSLARLGIQSHISAGFGDIGFTKSWTLEITVVHPVKIYPDIRIGQVYFHKVDDDALEELMKMGGLYQGKYSDQTIAQASMSYLDFSQDGASVVNKTSR